MSGRTLLHFALGVALVAGLAACGGSATTVVHTVHVPATTRHATTSSSTPTTTTTPATPTTTPAPPATSTACVAADLSLVFIGQQGAAGHGELGFALKNTSSSACHTYGYPGVLFLDAHGNGLTTIPDHTTIDYFGQSQLAELTIQPGQEVSFRLGVTHGAVPGSVCTTAAGLQVIPPDDTATLRVTIPSGGYECRNVTVSPLQPGGSAYR